MRKCFVIITTLLIASPCRPADFEAAAREVLANIVAKNYTAAAKNFDDRMMAALPPAKLREVMENQILPQIGAFRAVRDVKTMTDSGYTIIVLVSEFEKGPINVQVAFDTSGKVAGLFFKPAQPPAEPAATTFAAYETKTNLRLPFDGEWFVFWGGRTREQNYHVIARDQRFAYDFVINRDGATHSGDSKKNGSYYCWNQPIDAPADGVVTESVDGVADNTPGEMNPAAAAGNHVVIDHGNGEFSLLAHFRSGTVAPKTGDHVKRGDVIGRCGNSGNTSEPHLHYHLQNGPRFGVGEGLPAQFRDYMADGKKIDRGEPVKGQRITNAAK
ncbi:MAG: peptidoglycan DD-metalloendopeptidase family protein [Thermoanaerobaculia bacterium]